MKVVTKKIRVNYPNLFEAKQTELSDEKRYSVAILIPKSDIDTVEQIKEAIQIEKRKGLEIWKDIDLGDIKLPLRDGDIEKSDIKEYKNHYFVNATSKYKPGIVDRNLNEITDEKEIYPGCYARVSINFYHFNKNGQVGIGCGINNLQNGDGEYISINSEPEDDFSVIEDDFEELRIILAVDIETKSSVDLTKCGVYAYTEAKDFEILLIAYAFDDEPVSVIDIKSGDLIPSRVKKALLNPKIIKSAFNANFERVCLSKYFNVYLKPESFECSQVKALSLGLMPGLDNVAKILSLDIRKDKEGKNLIKYFNVKSPDSDLNKWKAFKNYCKLDCEIEIQIRKKLSKYKQSEKEMDIYFIDPIINDRGILVDKNLIDSAININTYYEEILKDN